MSVKDKYDRNRSFFRRFLHLPGPASTLSDPEFLDGFLKRSPWTGFSKDGYWRPGGDIPSRLFVEEGDV